MPSPRSLSPGAFPNRIEVFTYRASKDGKVFISWRHQQVKILHGEEARRFIDKIAGLNHKEAQLVMAKATGNFKRGNERYPEKT